MQTSQSLRLWCVTRSGIEHRPPAPRANALPIRLRRRSTEGLLNGNYNITGNIIVPSACVKVLPRTFIKLQWIFISVFGNTNGHLGVNSPSSNCSSRLDMSLASIPGNKKQISLNHSQRVQHAIVGQHFSLIVSKFCTFELDAFISYLCYKRRVC